MNVKKPSTFETKIRQYGNYFCADYILILSAIILTGLGIIMVTSSSIAIADRQLGDPFYYAKRQSFYAFVGIFITYLVTHIRMEYWQKAGMPLIMFALLLLALVLVPGIGRSVNGSMRWMDLGVLSIQVSEPARLFLLVYLAGYLVRRNEEVRQRVWGFLKPMIVFGSAVALILIQPDFGSSAVLLLTALGTMFVAGVRLFQFLVFMLSVGGIFFLLAISSPYRLQRLTTFLDPWADPFDSGFQLTQSLIAFGSGGAKGVGLGSSVQKLFYLPEAHNDFLFAILAEELGLIGVLLVLSIFTVLIIRGFRISTLSERAGGFFGAYLAFSITLWLALQTAINIGVSMGVLPTKGLTLPLMSSGGSSLLVISVAIGILLRIYHESRRSNVIRRTEIRKSSTLSVADEGELS